MAPPLRQQRAPPVAQAGAGAGTGRVAGGGRATAHKAAPPVAAGAAGAGAAALRGAAGLLGRGLRHRFGPCADGHADAAVHLNGGTGGRVLPDDGTGRLVAVLLGGAAQAQLVLHQQGAGIVHVGQAHQRRHLGRGADLRAAHIDHNGGAHRHLAAGGRVGADDGACRHGVVHGLGDQHRDAEALELLFSIGLQIVGHIRHGDVLDAEADGQGHALALADGAARHRRLPVNVSGRVVIAVRLLPVDGDLAGGDLRLGVHLILGHAAVIGQHDVGLFAHQGAGIVEDGPAQRHAGQRERNGDAEQHRQEDGLFLFAFAGLFRFWGFFFGFHGVLHHLFRNFIGEIGVIEHDGRVFHVGVQCPQHLGGAGVAVFGPLCHGAFGDLHQAVGHGGGQLLQALGLVGDLLDGHLHHIVGVKRQMPRKHLVHHDAHRIDVAGKIGLVALGLFRADIMDAAHRLAAGKLVLGAGDAGNAEVHHPQLAVVQQHDVLGLDVPMHHAVAVGMVQRFEDLGDEMHRFPAGQPAAALVEVLPQRHAVHVFHHDILQLLADRDIVHLDNVGVIEQRDGLGFVLEAADEVGVVHELLPQHLDGYDRALRHRPARPHDRLVDVGHAAGADQLPDGVQAIEGLADQIIHAPPPSAPRPAAAP